MQGRSGIQVLVADIPSRALRVLDTRLVLACIDKWVKSKFEDATPPKLCSGPKLAIWYKNQPSRPEKTPGHGEKSKMAILPLFGHVRVLGEKDIVEYNNSY